jgi:7,8-dihydroneopterin 2',3'-cyclic phosphate phosphodiesterase
MKELIELAKKIEDIELRKKVVEFLKNPRLTNKNFQKYKPEKIKDAGSVFGVTGPTSIGAVERDVLQHTKALTELCIKTADIVKKRYGISLNKDELIAASILHDIMKIFEFKRTKEGTLEHTGIMLDHTMLAVAEFYKRNFPENVIHIIAAHFGEAGPTPPRNFEALIFHYLDAMLSLVEYYQRGQLQQQAMLQQPQVIITEEELKKLIEKSQIGEKSETQTSE